jgi:hypothetical protein
MRIRVQGAGFYGCHIASALLASGHDVEVHEIGAKIMGGASGNIPARLHAGFHYPRSRMTRAACQEHAAAFLASYGHLTRSIPTNIYAVARDESLVDYDQYVRTLRGEAEFIEINPAEFGLANCEGAVLTGERHIVTDLARAEFEEKLAGHVLFGCAPGDFFADEYDWNIDATFCANSDAGVDRYEPCLVLLLEGPTDRAVTVMDGPFGSLYRWNEEKGLCSLSSAKWTPFSKSCKSYAEARAILDHTGRDELDRRAQSMIDAMAFHYPAVWDYRIRDYMLSIRAMPLSGADSRLVDVRQDGNTIRIRAGKIDAILHAERAVREIICCA